MDPIYNNNKKECLFSYSGIRAHFIQFKKNPYLEVVFFFAKYCSVET